MSFEALRTKFNMNMIDWCNRHNEKVIDVPTEKGVLASPEKHSIATSQAFILDKKKFNDNELQNLLQMAQKVHTHFFSKSYSVTDCRNAIEFLEVFVLTMAGKDCIENQENLGAKKQANYTLSSIREPELLKGHMKSFNSLEEVNQNLGLSEKEQKKALPEKIATTIHQVSKILANASLADRLILSKPVNRAIQVLIDYKKKLD